MPMTATDYAAIRAAEAARYAEQFAHITPPRWAVEVDNWSTNWGDEVLRPCVTHYRRGGVEVMAIGWQRTDGTLQHDVDYLPSGFDTDVPLSTERVHALADALNAAIADVEGA